MHIHPNLVRNAKLYFQEQGELWLENLPAQLDSALDAWNLTRTDPFDVLSINYVTRAIDNSSQSPVVLKLGLPREIHTEVTALTHFQNAPAMVRILKANTNEGWLLLEDIQPGTALYAHLDLEKLSDEAATEAAAHSLSAMHQRIQDEQLYEIFPSVRRWFAGLTRHWDQFEQSSGPIPHELFTHARDLIEELLDDLEHEAFLLHGDFHHGNIIEGADGTWRVIDPKGVIGPRVYELCPFLRNPINLKERYPDDALARCLTTRIELLSRICAIDTRMLCAFAFCESILSIVWDIPEGATDYPPGFLYPQTLFDLLHTPAFRS